MRLCLRQIIMILLKAELYVSPYWLGPRTTAGSVRQLSGEHREVILLRYFQEFSTEKTGDQQIRCDRGFGRYAFTMIPDQLIGSSRTIA